MRRILWCALLCGCGGNGMPAIDDGGVSVPANNGGAGGSRATGGSGGAGVGGAAGRATGGSGGAATGGSAGAGSGGSAMGGSGGRAGSGGTAGAGTGGTGGAVAVDDRPAAGNPDGKCDLPAEARAEDTSKPTNVIGNGTPESCTSDAVVSAVAKGGIIAFNCGLAPKTIVLERTAKIVNDTGPKIVIDGGGKITLSGGGKVRILYQNTCDMAQKYTTSHCQDQDHPQLTIQNLTFVDGNSKGDPGVGGGAVFVRGGRVKIINSRFFNNVCDDTGPDIGGAAVRTLSQSMNLPVYVVNSTFGGRDGLGNVCSNGGGLSSIGVSYTVINSLFSFNKAIGNGANPAKAGTPGGGSGGAIYNDGNTFTLTLCGAKITNNTANEGGGAIFLVSNDRSGSLIIRDSTLTANPSKGFETQGFPGIFVLAKGPPQVTNSTITK